MRTAMPCCFKKQRYDNIINIIDIIGTSEFLQNKDDSSTSTTLFYRPHRTGIDSKDVKYCS